MPYLQNALSLIVDTILGLYLITVILRFLFQLFRVDFNNPISQSIFLITKPPLVFFRRFIPGLFGIDLAGILLILVISSLKVALLALISGYKVAPVGLFLLSLGEAINITIWILLISIIASAIISWIAPTSFHPAIRIVTGISMPVLRPFRRFLPNLQGIDFSPILAILALNLCQMLVSYPLMDYGRALL